MFQTAGNANDALAAVANLGPDRAALAGTMHDPMRDAAQRYHCARKKGRSLRQTTETRSDPAAMTLREVLGLRNGAAWRDGQDRFAIARMDSQGVAARAPVSAKPDRVDLRAVLDEKARRFVGPPVKKRASGHILESGGQENAWILPYPTPGEVLGAKTNHLPYIQGRIGKKALQNGAGGRFF